MVGTRTDQENESTRERFSLFVGTRKALKIVAHHRLRTRIEEMGEWGE